MVNEGVVKLDYCGTRDQLATDILTKPLPRDVFMNLRDQLGVCSLKGKQVMDTMSSLGESLLE